MVGKSVARLSAAWVALSREERIIKGYRKHEMK